MPLHHLPNCMRFGDGGHQKQAFIWLLSRTHARTHAHTDTHTDTQTHTQPHGSVKNWWPLSTQGQNESHVTTGSRVLSGTPATKNLSFCVRTSIPKFLT